MMDMGEGAVHAIDTRGTGRGESRAVYAGRTQPHGRGSRGAEDVRAHITPDMNVPKNHDTIPTLAERSVVDKSGRARIRSLLSAMSRKTSCQPAIDRLPNEILCAIFFICGDPSSASAYPRDIGMHTYGKERYEIQRYSRSAALLGRVCVRWYAVTRDFPSLWTVVDIAYPTKEATSVLMLCLKYSSDLPLSLWITRSLDPDARKRAVDPRFMSLVAANAHRWREISMEFLDEIRVLEPLVSLPHGAFSSLEQGRIEFYKLEARGDTLDTRLWNMFFASPKLRCVDLTRTNFIRTGLASAPLRQLTSLGMHSAMPDMVPAVLSTCTSLELLCIQIEPMAFGIAGLPALPIPFSSHLPRLRVLMLCGPYDWAPLCNSLTAPALDRLDVARINIGPYIERMLVRSSARLRMLTIYRPGLGQGDIMLSLVRSSPLRSLRILRYTISYPGSADFGWEDAFDLRPFIPQGVIQAVGAAEAEQSYIKLCEGISSYGASPS